MGTGSPITIVGAGSIGLAAAVRLGAAGYPIHLIVRRPEAAARIAEGGIGAEDPASGAAVWVRPTASASLEASRTRIAAGPVLLCVRAGDTVAVAGALARVVPDATVVSAQNGVDADAILAERFVRPLGIVWRQTCTRTADDRVLYTGAGRVIVGAPDGDGGESADALAAAFAKAGFDVGRSARLQEDRWLKLCLNLLSAPNAMVRPDEHATPDFARLKVALLEEARAALVAAGIVARSCDGRDDSLDEMIAKQRAAIASPPARRALPIYNSAWSALRSERGPEESIAFHGRIVREGAAHGVATPANGRMVEVLRRLARERAGPESVGVAELLG